MIKCIKETELYRNLNLHKNLSHAYLIYSTDSELNNQIALTFAKSLLCEQVCNTCPQCKQFDSHSHPDIIILDQDSIKVEDVYNLMLQLNTLPVSNEYKIFLILNAENINELAQNKLLKSLEEPNKTNIFILTCAKTDKLLPTILSRLTKVYIPKLSILDKSMISRELQTNNVNISKYLDADFTLTEMINMETNENFLNTILAIKDIFTNLKSSADIPKVSSNIVKIDKTLFFPILQDIFLDCINNTKKYDPALTTLISMNYPEQALVNSLPYIEESYKKIMSNVNFSYILDNLLFNILKEKFLCKH
ncbi:MAG: hypothetical protein ACLRFL_01855 [Clostridia bacterium]